MRVSFHPDYRIDLPPPHPFPMGKYPLLHARLLEAGIVAPADVMTPEETPLEMLARVHTPGYLQQLATGTLPAAALRRLGVPLVIVPGGGYAPSTLRTAQLHAIVYEEAAAYLERGAARAAPAS
jgi:acetoin utilization deacetylase AcuC-like enzyme